jgi:rSAM/selenodomain-associated transferase 1
VFPTIPPPSNRLLVFARVPEEGRVKSRLAASIGSQRALALYEAMVRDTLRTIGPPTPDLEIEILWAPETPVTGETLRRAFGDRPLSMQTGTNLGDRLAMAFSERFYFSRTRKIVAIGIDDPFLKRETIDHAFGLLDSCEWVAGPATDGGYYLIGCRAASFNTEIFRGIEWGTESVMTATLAKIREWSATVAQLPYRSDIDVEADLARIPDVPGSEVSALLREWGRNEDHAHPQR